MNKKQSSNKRINRGTWHYDGETKNTCKQKPYKLAVLFKTIKQMKFRIERHKIAASKCHIQMMKMDHQ